MFEINFILDLEKDAPTAAFLQKYAPQEPYLGGVAVTIIKTVQRKNEQHVNACDTYSQFQLGLIPTLLENMEKAGFLWNSSQVSRLNLEKRIGQGKILEIKIKALEMTENDLTQKKT